ncbi:MAG: flagellar hook basal-body protein [Deltaproteobacteria bacterium]|nr:flagellar hook basal-body protein [Deltaproteobacteria bacterium]
MADGIYNAASGALARMEQLDVVANNLANASSNGFRAQALSFREVLAASGQGEVRQALVDGTRVKDTQGALVRTGRALDVALDGPGYFRLQSDNGPVLTRNGHFRVDAGGLLVNEDGLPVLGANGPVRVDPAARVSFSAEGEVLDGDEPVEKLSLVRYDAGDLRPLGGSLLTIKDGARPTQLDIGRVCGETLESSNTNVLHQMTEMISTNRLFDATMNAIDTYKQIDSKTAAGLSRR